MAAAVPGIRLQSTSWFQLVQFHRNQIGRLGDWTLDTSLAGAAPGKASDSSTRASLVHMLREGAGLDVPNPERERDVESLDVFQFFYSMMIIRCPVIWFPSSDPEEHTTQRSRNHATQVCHVGS